MSKGSGYPQFASSEAYGDSFEALAPKKYQPAAAAYLLELWCNARCPAQEARGPLLHVTVPAILIFTHAGVPGVARRARCELALDVVHKV